MDTPISRAEHNEFARRMEEENKRQNHRLDVLEKTTEQIQALALLVERLTQSVASMAKAQEEQGNRLKTMEDRDGELWRKAIIAIITAIAGAVVGYVFARAGIS